jgi:DNA-directed RNA polymerase subunit M/transcription elongation factor TFIIS
MEKIISNNKIISMKNNELEYINPYSYSNYDFITENSIDIKESWIQYAENEINRAEYQMKLANILLDVDIALKIELSIFEYSLIYCQNNKYTKQFIKSIYEDKFNSILTNIVYTPRIDNKNFKNLILNKNINPSYIAFLSPAQIHPSKWQNIIKKKEYIEQRENNISYSDAYKCYKCGESKCKISQAQTRSADEPMTTFVTCLVCHNTFKFC